MPQSQYRAREVSAKTQEVVAYDHDESLPGKPLHILIPGGLVALASLAMIIYVAYLTWFKGELDQGTGLLLIGLLAPFYVGGVFLFSYGYELYNIPRALRLTAIIVFLTVAAVVIVAVLFFLLGSGKGLPESSSKKKSSGKAKVEPRNTPTSSGGSGLPNLGPLVILGGPGRTHTREVTREVVKEVPVAPRSIDCPYCGRSYVPADQNYACPACGAATPTELIEESESPKDSSENQWNCFTIKFSRRFMDIAFIRTCGILFMDDPKYSYPPGRFACIAWNLILARAAVGFGRFALLLSKAGMRFVPIGGYEAERICHLHFGEPYELSIQSELSTDEWDERAIQIIMGNIACLLPTHLRKEFA